MKKLIIVLALFCSDSASANLKDFFNDGGYKASIITLVCAISTLPFLLVSFKKSKEAKELQKNATTAAFQDRARNRRSLFTRTSYQKAQQKWKDSKFYFNLGLLGVCCTLTFCGITTFQSYYFSKVID